MKYLNKEVVLSWAPLLGIVFFLYYVFSSGQFSFIFTIAGTVQTFGFALIVLRIRKSRSVTGLSRETFICYTLIFALRSILFQFYRVSVHLFRDTSPMTKLAILSSKFRSSWRLSSQFTSSTPSWSSLKAATART